MKNPKGILGKLQSFQIGLTYDPYIEQTETFRTSIDLIREKG